VVVSVFNKLLYLVVLPLFVVFSLRLQLHVSQSTWLGLQKVKINMAMTFTKLIFPKIILGQIFQIFN